MDMDWVPCGMRPEGEVLILGASARAAAFSALRAGLRPRCIDFFADRDLAAVCPVSKVGDEPNPLDEFERIGKGAGSCPWIYTGPFENHPGIVERVSTTRPLWGNSAEVLRGVRDPFVVAEILGRAGLPCPSVQRDPSTLPRDVRWLVKPLASGGGRSIRLLDDHPYRPVEPVYYQEFVDGPSFSALFLAAAGQSRLVGVTRQIIGGPGAAFAYRGSIGPWPPPARLTDELRCLGRTLAAARPLVGLFGVDFVLRDQHAWPVEINPRYTASVEILEPALGRSLLGEHRRACESHTLEVLDGCATEPSSPRSHVLGKMVVYATTDLVTPRIEFGRGTGADAFTLPDLADIPWPGTKIRAGEPVLTVFASGPDEQACLWKLEREETGWREQLSRGNTGG